MKVDTPFTIAERMMGMKEVAGPMSNPQVLAMLKLDNDWPEDDSVPWCAAFVNFCFWIMGIEGRSKSLRARSWLKCGFGIPLSYASKGFDVVVLKRSGENQPGPEVINAPGHVGFYHSHSDSLRNVALVGGNQGDAVNIKLYPQDRIIGVRRVL
jgi:uncharacterized protein (TIGR02594 family)